MTTVLGAEQLTTTPGQEEPETATEERAISTRSIPLKWRHHRTDKGGLVEEHTAVALESILANFDGILTVLVSDAARTTHCGGFIWLEFGGYGGKKGRGRRCHCVRTEGVTTSEGKRLPPAAWSSNSAFSSSIASLSMANSAFREPQL
jgi:hypothetical protein